MEPTNAFEKKALTSATMDQLFVEICRRSQDCILIADVLGKIPGDNISEFRYYGTTAQVMGLIAYAQLEVNKRVLQGVSE